jgi:hypothetical protein
MRRKISRGTAVAAVTLVAAVAGGVALAGGAFDRKAEQQAFLKDAAGRLNVSADDLQTALQSAFDDRIDAAVAAGRLTQAQGDALKTQAAKGGLPLGVGGPRLGGRGFDHGRGLGSRFVGGLGDVLDTAATYIGIDQRALITELQSGKSLAAVATERGKTQDGLKQAVLDAAKEELDQAVGHGRLTQAQADSKLSELDRRVGQLLTSAFPLPGDRAHGIFGFGHFGGSVGDVLDAAATYLGVDDGTLRDDLASGKTLADVAKAQGKSTDGLKTAIHDSTKKELDQAVTDTRLTQSQADSMLEKLDDGLDTLVTKNLGGLGHPGFGGRFGHGGFGPPAGGGAGAPPALAPSATA